MYMYVILERCSYIGDDGKGGGRNCDPFFISHLIGSNKRNAIII